MERTKARAFIPEGEACLSYLDFGPVGYHLIFNHAVGGLWVCGSKSLLPLHIRLIYTSGQWLHNTKYVILYYIIANTLHTEDNDII